MAEGAVQQQEPMRMSCCRAAAPRQLALSWLCLMTSGLHAALPLGLSAGDVPDPGRLPA
jgi:hypothetical protein